MDDPPAISRFCIFHYVDPGTDNYAGYISPPVLVRKSGKTEQTCLNNPIYRDNIYKSFYAFSPMLRPIPLGMQLFRAKRTPGSPYVTEDVQFVYDIFNLRDGGGLGTYFLAYSQPVPHTAALYLHTRGGNLFPTFSEKPPTDDVRWRQTTISPIYVLTPESIGKTHETMNTIKFRCMSGRCLPTTGSGKTNSYDASEYMLPIQECIVRCNQVVSKNDIPTSLINSVSTDSALGKVDLPSAFGSVPLYFVGMIICVFVTVLLILVIKIKNEKSNLFRGWSKNERSR